MSVVHQLSSVLNLLYHEYLHTIIDTLHELPQTLSNKLKESQKLAKEQVALEECQIQLDIEEAWPIVMNSTVVKEMSSDPVQLFVFHGNTCAHETNLLSTVKVLSCTPADINVMLTIVFVGATKLDAKSLRSLFHVRKQVVWSFLCWLATHNRLYEHISLDADIMDLYPDDRTLPGLAKHIVYDHDSDVDAVFAKETVGFSEHPTQSFIMLSNPTTGEPDVLLESMGVSDPKCTKISGHAITASALRNLMSVSPEEPDLVLHRSAELVTDYHNPNLLPDMFPTLYPFGIGGFDDNT
ncbi:hypothetical protein EDD22DRAFT_949113 [Suillus occidentalis]|nr:hypothetical protein EDD22DRAFT_949113 [Suillus occidentalis]